MTRVTAVAAALLAVTSTGLDAHRLDELLQAAQVEVTPATVSIHLNLSPGVAVAADTITRLDADGDRLVSPAEAGAYGRSVMRGLDARLDGAALPLTLVRVDAPTVDAMRDGLGTIRVEMTGPVPAGMPGRHLLELTNGYLPGQSVYMANALLPGTDAVVILRQERDALQQAYRLHFETRPDTGMGAAAAWVLGGAAALLALARWRRGSPSLGRA